MGLPPVLLAGPPYRPGQEPGRETRLERLNPEYARSPWQAALVSFRGFLAVLIGLFVAVILLIGVGSGDAGWWYALSLAVLEAARAGLRVLRCHRRERAGGRP